MTRSLVLLLVLGGACKKDGDSIAALQTTTTVTGSAIVITATCTNFASMAAADQAVFASCEAGKVRVEVPIAKLVKGQRTIHVRASDENGKTMAEADVAVDLSRAGQPPYLRIAGCSAPAGAKSTGLTVKVGDRSTDCDGSGAGVKLAIEANPHAKLTIAGKTQTAPEAEAVEQTVDLGAAVLGLKLDDIAIDPALPLKKPVKATITVPYSVESEGKTISGNIEIAEATGSEGGLARSYLAVVAEGKGDRSVFTPTKPGERRTAAWITRDDKLRVTDRTGLVRDLDLIGVEHDGRRTENGTCDYKSEDKQIRAKRILVDVELAVINLADGKVETKSFAASEDPRNCPMFSVMDPKDPKTEARPHPATLDTWLASHAE